MVVSQNIPALMIHTNLQRNDRLLKTSVLRLGSGYRINSVKDDPTGLAITNKLTFQITGLNRASENASHGISLVQTAEGALNEVHNMLQRMRELAVYAAHGTLENSDREKIQVEIDELLDEINLISDRTEFNKIKVLSGEASRINDSREMIDVGGGVFEPSASVDKTIAKMLYMSDRTPAKVYEYTIKSVGTPAVCSNFQPIDASLPCPGGIFSINGEQIYIPAGTTFADAQNFMRDACYYHGLDYFAYDDGVDTKACLVSKIAGSNQKIEISGDSGLLAYLGLASGTGASAFVGTDAVLEDISYGLTFLANGNQVSIKGTNGEEINFNLQVLLQRDESDALIAPPVFVFGDGKKIAAAFDAAGALQPAGDVRMMFDIKEYG
ncbi:MAG: hypothetical protein FWF03_06930, partial [Defluviitaleaceae bacterium]|nr:hypothetical protein [Defluviitaleaceae bacterium]